jgi:thiol-disulfide isomerase/thioredoxin
MNIQRATILLCLVLCCFTVVGGALYMSESTTQRALRADTRSAALSATTLVSEDSGTHIDIKSDVPILAVVWASWCTDCVPALEFVARVREKFGDRVRSFAINRSEDRSVVLAYRQQTKLPSGLEYVYDLEDTYYRRIEGIGMPHVAFFGKNGVLIYSGGVPTHEEELMVLITKELERE